MRAFATLMICLVAAPSAAQAAKIYKCVDEKGHTTFSQSHCSSSAQAVNVRSREPTEAELQAAYARNESANQFISERKMQREAAIQRQREEAIAYRAGLDAREAQRTTAKSQRDTVNDRLERTDKFRKATGQKNDAHYSQWKSSVRENANREDQDRFAEQANRQNEENQQRILAEQKERDNRREVENRFHREQNFQNVGVMGRDGHYDRSLKECRRTMGANCP